MISDNLRKRILEAILFVGNEIDDFIVVKRELINLMPRSERKMFSKRHWTTKKHVLNDLEKEIIEFWEQETGVKLKLYPEKAHPENWEQKKVGWGLSLINKERQRIAYESRQKKQKPE